MLHELTEFDVDLTNRIRLKSTSSRWWRLAALMAHSGDSWVWAIGLALVWLFSSLIWHDYAAVLEISIVIQALTVFSLKGLIRRRRPEGEWGGIYRQLDPHSFPSGHATRAVMLAVLALSLGPAWFGWLVAVWAPLVCLSRVMTGVHYISDILGGMVLGLAMGVVLVGLSSLWPVILPFLF
jgi:membrane-associated phospholipid phosphatase